jgi:hypothetical protein
MALTHRVLIVAGPAGVEFHLDHRIAPGRGQHRIVGSEDLAAWMADAGDVHPAFDVATTCPCRRDARRGPRQEEWHVDMNRVTLSGPPRGGPELKYLERDAVRTAARLEPDVHDERRAPGGGAVRGRRGVWQGW